jgi:5-methylcytosine-specific restriction endonuclease McrA
MPSSDQIRAQRRALRSAQRSICAGCGEHLPSARRVKRHHPDYPTFDHFVPRSQGGGRTLDNGLLKHRRCNQARGNRPPTGCDRLWRETVRAWLALRSLTGADAGKPAGSRAPGR